MAHEQVSTLVETFGEVLSVSGLSVKHGPNKRFRAEDVVITDEELTEDLLRGLLGQESV
jgi:hypothetical protein